MGKSTISMAIFIRELLNYQRVLGGIYIVPAEKTSVCRDSKICRDSDSIAGKKASPGFPSFGGQTCHGRECWNLSQTLVWLVVWNIFYFPQ